MALRDVFFFLKMRWRSIVLSTLIVVGLAFAYLLTAPQTFIATTQLLVFPQISASEAQRAFAEDAFLEAQIEIASSSDVLDATAASLNLAADPAFAESAPSLMDRAKTWLKTPDPQDTVVVPANLDKVRLDHVVARLQNMVSVRRIGRSTIMEISASAANPVRAAMIADSVAAQYISKNLRMKAQGARQHSEWLEKIVAEQQKELTLAANALATFKGDPKDQFKLAELQSTTDARRTLFQNTLSQYTEAKQRISYPVSDATIVSNATPPLSKSSPRNSLILAFAAIVGTGAGLVIALMRHALDRRIIRPQSLAQAAGLPFVTPLSVDKASVRNFIRPKRTEGGRFGAVMPGMAELAATIAGLRRRRKIILGFVAVDSGAGASTIACELAVLSGVSGARTLLIDASADSRSLSRLLSAEWEVGLVEVLERPDLLQVAAVPITSTLRFLPLGKIQNVTPAIRLSSRRTELNLNELRNDFDAVFVDMSAFNASPDASALAPELDGVIVITSYGSTSIDETTRVVEALRNVGAEVLGAVINNAPKRVPR
jgi:Mrp family chromosome partitioning ATPase/capsular polysaccharide biosynthesis protein